MNALRSAAPLVRRLLDLSQQELSYPQVLPLRDLLRREGLWIAALESCSRGGESLPPEPKLELVQAVAWELSCRASLKQSGELALARGVQPVVFKGVALASQVYRAGQRSFGDVDIAAVNSTRDQLISLLQEQGGELFDGDFPEVVLGRIRYDIHDHPLGQFAQFLELPGEPWGEDARPLSSEMKGIWALAPEHEFLLALFHGAKHCFSRANWVLDVAMLAYRSDANSLAAAVRRHRAGRHLWLAQQCLQEWFEVELPPPLKEAARPPRFPSLASVWLKNRVLARRAPDFLGMLTPLWAIFSWQAQYRYLKFTLFPRNSGIQERLGHLAGLLKSVFVREG